MTPVVSVVLVTYNHERYVAQAIRSVLDQEADFGIELLVTEDCSTDRTREVIREAVAGEEDRVRVLLSERNQCDNDVAARAIRAARGKFIAFLDGDDYWTAPDKLRRQVEHLEARPDCAMCFHAVDVVYDPGVPPAATRQPGPGVPARLRLEDILEHNPVPGCSPVIRAGALRDLPPWFTDAEFGDWPLYLFAATHGSIDYIDEIMGVYRVHRGGYWTGVGAARKYESMIAFWERARGSIDDALAPRIRQIQAKRWARVAQAYVDAGDVPRAWRAAARSIRLAPVNRRLPASTWPRLAARMARAAVRARRGA